MPNINDKKITDPQGGMFNNLTLQIKLIMHLMGDRRVNPFIKLIPIASVAYFLIPDLVIGPIDDALVIWLSTYLFVELCPPEIVQEHKDQLRNIIPTDWSDPTSPPENSQQPNVIDTEFKDSE